MQLKKRQKDSKDKDTVREWITTFTSVTSSASNLDKIKT